MKAVLISIQPKWCELIASGKKTVEVRKTKPKLETPFKCHIYCTKGDWLTSVNGKVQKLNNMVIDLSADSKVEELNGKVIGEFVCDKFTYIEAGYDTNGNKHLYNTAFIEHRMCIPDNELHEYLYKSRENCRGWAWHISDLVIYDKPKELGEFRYHCRYEFADDFKHCNGCDYYYFSNTPSNGREEWCICDGLKRLTRPPQSWCYVEELR